MVKTIQMTSSPEPPGGFGLYFAGSIWDTSLYKKAKIIPCPNMVKTLQKSFSPEPPGGLG